eukprot:3138835-Prymnesium_polylepis.10
MASGATRHEQIKRGAADGRESGARALAGRMRVMRGMATALRVIKVLGVRVATVPPAPNTSIASKRAASVAAMCTLGPSQRFAPCSSSRLLSQPAGGL